MSWKQERSIIVPLYMADCVVVCYFFKLLLGFMAGRRWSLIALVAYFIAKKLADFVYVFMLQLNVYILPTWPLLLNRFSFVTFCLRKGFSLEGVVESSSFPVDVLPSLCAGRDVGYLQINKL